MHRRCFSFASDRTPIPEETIDPDRIRNFGIIAHIDHGKSTLADRLLEATGSLPRDRPIANQILDSLPVERERGITVKAQAATMFHRQGGHWYQLNLVDTPGHADFCFEVQRGLLGVQGALLVVDAAAGIQAQTVSHYLRAKQQGLVQVLPVINKIDLPTANVAMVQEQLQSRLDVWTEPLLVSARTGLGIPQLIAAIIVMLPPPPAKENAPLRVRLLDSWFQPFRGVVCLVAILAGELKEGDTLLSATTGKLHPVGEVGIMRPEAVRTGKLTAGQVGYLFAGSMRTCQEARLGDTLHRPGEGGGGDEKQQGGRVAPPAPTVWAGLFPPTPSDYPRLAQALDRLLLNDGSVQREGAESAVLGAGWRLGFLGSLHLDVFRQRLQQEWGAQSPIVTAPTVPFKLKWRDGREVWLRAPADYPSDDRLGLVASFREPWVRCQLRFPADCLGKVIQWISTLRAEQEDLQYEGEDRVGLSLALPLLELLNCNLQGRLLSLCSGYAAVEMLGDSSDPTDWRPVDLIKLTIRLNGDPIDVLTGLYPRSRATAVGRAWVERLRDLLPRQQFTVAIQAAIGAGTSGGSIVARETLSALRKDVTAKCYGGDRTRQLKLLEKQKEGKLRMRQLGRLQVPQEIFVAMVQRLDLE